MNPWSSLVAPLLLCAFFLAILSPHGKQPQTTESTKPKDKRTQFPHSEKSLQQPASAPLDNSIENLPSHTSRRFSKVSHQELEKEKNGAEALQSLSLVEVIQKFEKAIGPSLSRSLPKHRKAQIFERFRHRLSNPLDPTSFLCWSEQTPSNIVDASHRAELFADRLIQSEISAQAFQSFESGRWSTTANGSTGSYGNPATLTWSIAPDGAFNDESQASDLIARLATIYSVEGANTIDPPAQQPWFPLFVSAITDMSKETGIIFVYEENDDGARMSSGNDGINNVRGDIRIFGGDIDGNSGTLAYNYSPGYGDMVIDTNDSFFTNKSNNSIRLRNTLGHEIGHGLGLGHVCPRNSTKLMEPIINTNFEGGQFDEVYSLQRRYGDHQEREGGFTNNDSTVTAGTLDLTPGITLTIDERLSIDDNSDSDYFKIIVSSDQSLTATVTPTNESYLEGGDDVFGDCTGGWINYNFATFHDLGLQIRNSSGTPLLTSNTQGLGSAETISYAFPSSGTYYLRVFGDSTDRAQIYDLSVLLQNPATTLSLSSTDTEAEEGNSANSASVVVNSSSPVTTPLSVTLVPSGNAGTDDYNANLTAIIPAGQLSSNPVIIEGAPDTLSEGNETLTLTLPPYTSGSTPYSLGSPSSLDIIILNQVTPVFTLSSSITTESFSGQNGVPDPDETIEVTMTLENMGAITGTNVTGTLSGPSNFVPFDVVRNFGTISSSSTANAPFVFGFTGSCGESVIINLAVSSDEGVSQQFSLQYDLGIPGVPTTEDMEHSGDLPPDWTSSSTGAGVDWTANSSLSTSGTYSAFVPSSTTTGSSTFTSPVFTLPSPPGAISFSHIYGFQANKDGGVLEIAIDGGAWQDILVAGGTFTANGYDSVLVTSSNPLSGRNAWSGSSGGVVTTTLDLPPNSGGLPIQLRWVTGSDDSSKFLGWYLDDIFTPRGDSCDTSGPSLVLSASGSEISEGDPNQTVTLTVATDPLLPVISPVLLEQNSSGSTASPNTDVNGASESSPMIPAGSGFYSTSISAIFDSEIEGNETLALAYAPAPGSLTITIADSPYALWALSNLGSGGNIGATQDFDLDGSSNIEEYAFQTLGNDADSRPSLSWGVTDSSLELLTPPQPWPGDLEIIGKTSTDLNIWTETGVTETANGFAITFGSDQRFLRLFYSLSTPAE